MQCQYFAYLGHFEVFVALWEWNLAWRRGVDWILCPLCQISSQSAWVSVGPDKLKFSMQFWNTYASQERIRWAIFTKLSEFMGNFIFSHLVKFGRICFRGFRVMGLKFLHIFSHPSGETVHRIQWRFWDAGMVRTSSVTMPSLMRLRLYTLPEGIENVQCFFLFFCVSTFEWQSLWTPFRIGV